MRVTNKKVRGINCISRSEVIHCHEFAAISKLGNKSNSLILDIKRFWAQASVIHHKKMTDHIK
jgi:hypothetical protein